MKVGAVPSTTPDFQRVFPQPQVVALPFQVGPASNEPARLVIEMSKLDLQPPFRGRRPLAKNLENEAGAVDHLGASLFLQVLLLDWRQGRIDDEQTGAFVFRSLGYLLDLAFAE